MVRAEIDRYALEKGRAWPKEKNTSDVSSKAKPIELNEPNFPLTVIKKRRPKEEGSGGDRVSGRDGRELWRPSISRRSTTIEQTGESTQQGTRGRENESRGSRGE